MPKNYKELRNCRMCKKRFVVPEKATIGDYQELFYCKDCFKKYFSKK